MTSPTTEVAALMIGPIGMSGGLLTLVRSVVGVAAGAAGIALVTGARRLSSWSRRFGTTQGTAFTAEAIWLSRLGRT